MRRANKYKTLQHLFVDYYRIRQRVAYPLPICKIENPGFQIRGFNASYPWSIWMSWALEERIGALGYAAELCGDGNAAEAARRDLFGLVTWPSYLHDERPQLVFAHAVRTMWCAAWHWTWIDAKLREALLAALQRAVDEILPLSDSLHGRFSCPEDILETAGRHSHLHNIPIIATLSAASAARIISHPASMILENRAKMLIEALLALRQEGVTEALTYDGYVLDFIADWLTHLAEEPRTAILEHPRINDTLLQSIWLSAPGNLMQVAALGDVEPYEMPFHISAHAKLQNLRHDPLRAWFLHRCDLDALRTDALAALITRSTPSGNHSLIHSPPGRTIDANYAMVLRTGWEEGDICVAAGSTTSPMSHVHRDNGSLMIGTRGRWVIDDAGYQQYLETAERSFSVGDNAHNAPVINGFAQTKKRLSERQCVTIADDVYACHLNLTHSYPPEAGAKWVTRTIWLLGREHVVVCDQSAVKALDWIGYTWHGHHDCAWWVEREYATLYAPDEARPLLYVSSPHVTLKPENVSRLRGSRGQMSLSVVLQPEQPQMIANRRLICWLFSTEQLTKINTQNWPYISVGKFHVDMSIFR